MLRSLAVLSGMKLSNDHAEPTVERNEKYLKPNNKNTNVHIAKREVHYVEAILNCRHCLMFM